MELTPAAIRAIWIRVGIFASVMFLSGGCDLQTKSWAEQSLAPLPRHSSPVFDPWLDFSLTYNHGTAFSLVRDLGDARWFFGGLALLVVAALAAMVARTQSTRFEALALGAVAGGALGNAFDRLFRVLPSGKTGVVDFIRINYPWGGSWPSFNVADMLIVCGVIAIFLASWRARPNDDTGERANSVPSTSQT